MNTKGFRARKYAVAVVDVRIRDISANEDNKRDICSYPSKWGEYVRNHEVVDNLAKTLKL